VVSYLPNLPKNIIKKISIEEIIENSPKVDIKQNSKLYLGKAANGR
jgi:hypothetical protein